MDYEQKYKEANDKVAARFGTNVAKEIFTDLYESEDEKIRKELIDFFQDWHKIKPSRLSVNVSDILAWLEKQGEHANFRNKIQIGDKVTRNEAGILVNISQLNRVAKKREKQGEQKPTDKDMVEALRTEYEKGRADVIADTISWLENCWPRYCSNQTIIKGFKEAIKGE